MVNNRNVSAYQGKPPTKLADTRIYIKDGPIYSKADILALLTDESKTIFWTRKCSVEAQKLAFDIADAQELVKLAITKGIYKKSEWCVQKPTGPWAACDSYVVFRNEWLGYARKEIRCEYYVKFAIAKSGKLLLLVSCHMSQ